MINMHKRIANNEKDYKARLEYKLYLARENPEPVFDLSECNLKSIPSGVYSLCKVFRKEALLLQFNQLTSLSGGGQLSDLRFIKVLNLNNNQLLNIPDGISNLINIEELLLASNKLKRLPDSIGGLVNLRIVDCSHNQLELLPKSFGNLNDLTVIDLRYNPNLISIPSKFFDKASLCKVFADEHLFNICSSKRFEGEEVAAKMTKQDQDTAMPHSTECNNRSIENQKSFNLFGQEKEEKLLKLLESERNLQVEQDTKFKKHSNQNSSKLLNILKTQEHELDLNVMKCQNKKEKERARLIDNLVLDNTIESLIIEENVLKNSENNRKNVLLAAMKEETESQKALVANLLERSDLRSQNLVLQMALLQQQLAVLTAVEIERKYLCQQERSGFLNEKRKNLSDMLVSLLQNQGDQHEKVLDTFQHFEAEGQLCQSDPNFWYQQYQQFLEKGPRQIKLSIDYDLVHQFVINGMSHYLPLIINLDLYSLTNSQLDAIGIKHSSDQEAIMKAVEAYILQKQCVPSAPPPFDEASAPPLPPDSDSQFECVVCMERQCAIIFLPCGHCCCCPSCSSLLTICPLCRATLERKINIIIP